MAGAKKKKTDARPKAIEYYLDNEPSSLLEIIENSPDDTIWKEYIEKNNLQGSASARRYLKKKIGDYLSAGEINKRTGIKARVLDKWRGKGQLQAQQLGGRWYYSLRSVINSIKPLISKIYGNNSYC